ncbi:MAG TPA: hypothetical protein VN366_10000 [Feifaniaceae bacterium]|nr:hypothetical protein [Feifaniaceae bacterium]
MKKAFLAPIILALAALLFSACAAQPAEPTPAPALEAIPIYADQIAEGAYAIEVLSSSSMFRVVDAQLRVKDGAMTCVMTMSGQGYGKLYMGTGEQALADTEEHTIPSVINADGAVTFEVPVEALDMDIDCAAWSIKKESWYDRVLVFQSAPIPADAIAAE